MTNERCECDHQDVASPEMESWYDPVTEAPFRAHEPHQCKCTNDIRLYERAGKRMLLCSCCHVSGDTLVWPTDDR